MDAKQLQEMIDDGDLQGLMQVTRQIAESTFTAEGIQSPADVAGLLMAEMSGYEQEHFVVLLLDVRNKVIDQVNLYIGTVNSAMIRVAEVFRQAIVQNATSIIVAHNHPSGDPSPSPEDVAITRAIRLAGELLDIELLDSLVIGNGRFTSLKEKGLFN